MHNDNAVTVSDVGKRVEVPGQSASHTSAYETSPNQHPLFEHPVHINGRELQCCPIEPDPTSVCSLTTPRSLPSQNYVTRDSNDLSLTDSLCPDIHFGYTFGPIYLIVIDRLESDPFEQDGAQRDCLRLGGKDWPVVDQRIAVPREKDCDGARRGRGINVDGGVGMGLTNPRRADDTISLDILGVAGCPDQLSSRIVLGDPVLEAIPNSRLADVPA